MAAAPGNVNGPAINHLADVPGRRARSHGKAEGRNVWGANSLNKDGGNRSPRGGRPVAHLPHNAIQCPLR
jgi:hypothetical protein